MQEPGENGPRPTTQLDFNQAMKDFATMFPEMDRDVIEEVLRANQGAVEATIDQLLAMNTDYLNETLRLDLEKTDGAPDVTKHCSPTPPKPSKKNKRWTPPHVGPLPPSFLRLASPVQDGGSDTGEDERIAMFLQNEEFLSELRINEDFLHSLDDDLGDRHDTDAFKDRLKHMGKVSKNKFTQLARVFQRRKKGRSSKGLLDQASGDGLLLSGDSLLADRDDSSSGHHSDSPSPSQGHRP